LTAGTSAAITLEAFKYLGAGTVVERSRPEVNVTLSMLNLSGTAGAAGDKYTGLDGFGRVVDQRWTQGTAATSPVVDRYSYTYDRNSNRLTRVNGVNASFNETYAYDETNQLTSFARGGAMYVAAVSQSWSFDALGNRTSTTTNDYYGNWSANAQNEVTGIASLAYSRTGNLTTDAAGRTLVYDAWNRLVSVKNASGVEVARYQYDGLNRRIVELVGTAAAPAAANAPVRDSYYSQDWQVLEERRRTAEGAIPATAETRFVWSPVYVDAMIARDSNADGRAGTGTGGLEQRVYALQDANWNTTAVVAATGVTGITAGSVINRFLYTPYGASTALTINWANVRSGGPATTAPFPWAHLFQGLEFTSMTSLAYARNRDYSAGLGRFIQLDPIGFNAGDNNWYRFVGNGPTGKVDPSGLIPLDTIWDVGNIIYDIAIGDHVSLAADVAALAVPYVPAGSTKLVAAAKVADVVGWNSRAVRSLKVEYKYIGIADNFRKHTLPASAASKTWMTMTKGNPSKFMPGWGDKEIKGLIQEAFDEAKKKGLVKPEQLNGYVYDAKRTIGASDGCPAKRVEIKINKNGANLHAFPVR